MNRKFKVRMLGIVATAGVVGALGIVAAGTTGAYFSDTKSGTVSGTVGSIKVTTAGGSGADHLDLSYDRLLPGEAQTVTANYTNTGLNTEDVWVVFPNADALHALNNLGTYGELHLANNNTPVFDSANLNDNSANSCGQLSPAGCWPLPKMVKVASSVAPSANVNSLTFTFNYASKLQGQTPAGGGVWNAYPLGAPTASGLPYQIVATQVGQTP